MGRCSPSYAPLHTHSPSCLGEGLKLANWLAHVREATTSVSLPGLEVAPDPAPAPDPDPDPALAPKPGTGLTMTGAAPGESLPPPSTLHGSEPLARFRGVVKGPSPPVNPSRASDGTPAEIGKKPNFLCIFGGDVSMACPATCMFPTKMIVFCVYTKQAKKVGAEFFFVKKKPRNHSAK